MRSIRIGSLLAIAAFAVVDAQQPQQPPPLFRAGANVIAVDAVVHDKGGRFVLDLQPGDFQLTEDGKPQPIDQLYLVRGTSVGGRGAAPLSSDAPFAPAPPQAPAPRVFVAVFDTDHLTAGGFKRVQAAAATLFQKEFQKGDIGGVIVKGEMANKRLTNDREELINAVATAKPAGKLAGKLFDLREWPAMNDAEAFQIAQKGLRNNPVLDEVVRRACADDPDACKRFPPDATVYEKAQRMAAEMRSSSDQTLRMLAALMNGLERIEGRKTVLLLSEGFVADESWPIVQQTVGAAARANARIYSLDARGLDKGRQPIGQYAPHDDTLGNLLGSFDIGADSINSLAVDTGGFVVRNTNIFDQVVAEIAAEAGTFYVLGYRSAVPPDGKFHKIVVKVNRPGLSVRARRGFVASATPLPTITEAAAAEAPAPSTLTPSTPAPSTPAPSTPAPSTPAPSTPAPSTSAPSTPAPSTPAPSTPAPDPSAPSASRKNALENVRSLASGDASTPSNAIVASPARDAQAEASAGWDAYRRGDLESARKSLGAAAATPSARPWVHYALGQTAYALRDFAQAIASWEQVRASAPEFEPVYFDLVDGYLQSRDPDKATRVLRAASERWPKDHEVFSALGVVQMSRRAVDDAIKSFEQAIALAPDDAVGYFNLAKSLEIRFARSRRYVVQTRMWVSNESDRKSAIANYQRYLEFGGPFENSAREGLERLGWSAK
jgi:VWFA-related protein